MAHPTRIGPFAPQSEVDRLEHVYRNGVQPDCKEEYRDVRVKEEFGCPYDDEGDSDPMNWGGKD